METGRIVMFGVYAFIGLYLLYKLLFEKDPYQREYEKMYNDIINSSKHKVKGQFDKED